MNSFSETDWMEERETKEAGWAKKAHSNATDSLFGTPYIRPVKFLQWFRLDLSKIMFANHFKKNMAVCGLFPHLNSTESHKTLEQWFIFHSATLDHGINESYSFN